MPTEGTVNNPDGKGGFKDHPELINQGGRPKNEQRFGYWLQFFKDLTNNEFINYVEDKPEDKMYVAEIIAYTRVLNSRKDLKEYTDLADRTEGKATFKMEVKGEIDTGMDKVADLLQEMYAESHKENPKNKKDS